MCTCGWLFLSLRSKALSPVISWELFPSFRALPELWRARFCLRRRSWREQPSCRAEETELEIAQRHNPSHDASDFEGKASFLSCRHLSDPYKQDGGVRREEGRNWNCVSVQTWSFWRNTSRFRCRLRKRNVLCWWSGFLFEEFLERRVRESVNEWVSVRERMRETKRRVKLFFDNRNALYQLSK